MTAHTEGMGDYRGEAAAKTPRPGVPPVWECLGAGLCKLFRAHITAVHLLHIDALVLFGALCQEKKQQDSSIFCLCPNWRITLD